MTEEIYHLNDKTMKYIAMAQIRLLHKYLGLPGEYISSYPNEVVLPNMESGRADAFYAVSGNMLINLEEESSTINERTLQKFAKYMIFGNFIHHRMVYAAVISNKNPKNFPKEYKITPTNILKPKYIYFEENELWEKYENLINKIKQKDVLSEMEALDIAFIPKFISKKNSSKVTETLAVNFKNANIKEKQLKTDVGIILGAMILKNILDKEKQQKLMEMIGMDQGLKNDIQIILKEEIEEINEKLAKKDEEIREKNVEINEKNVEINEKNVEINEKTEELDKILSVVKQLHNEGEINRNTMNKILQTNMASK